VDNPPRVVCLRQTDAAIFYTAVYPPSSPDTWDTDRRSGTTKRWLDDYFQLTRYPDLGELYGDWRKRDPAFFATVELGSGSTGVRVLRQDPWECLVA
jgi:N-glycosylase/DNA lyase